ncbi:MAG TPA: LacI family DNA-binding transcriptional regulator [Ruminiclostridium sp.]|nr:LacI family DNA-binding transcriptional regulator [Ruminiclostridium sp.]
MATMKDVAKLAGVSLITVSRVINSPEIVSEPTRAKVEKAMEELEFLPNFAAKALAENITRTIHLYIPRTLSISDPFTMNLIAGISEELSDANYLFLVKRDLEFNQRCDGVIVMGLELSEENVFSSRIKIPFVLFGKTDLDIDCIDVDNLNGSVSMMEHIIENGHRRIGFLMIKSTQRYAYERFEGYKSTLKKYNIPFDESLVRYADITEQGGYTNALDLMTKEKPTAIFCSVDLLAIGAFRAAEKLKLKIPRDISIAGFDGIIFDLIPKVPLTTVRQPVYETGRALAARLLQRLKNPGMPYEKLLIQPELKLRKSVGRVKD